MTTIRSIGLDTDKTLDVEGDPADGQVRLVIRKGGKLASGIFISSGELMHVLDDGTSDRLREAVQPIVDYAVNAGIAMDLRNPEKHSSAFVLRELGTYKSEVKRLREKFESEDDRTGRELEDLQRELRESNLALAEAEKKLETYHEYVFVRGDATEEYAKEQLREKLGIGPKFMLPTDPGSRFSAYSVEEGHTVTFTTYSAGTSVIYQTVRRGTYAYLAEDEVLDPVDYTKHWMIEESS